MATPANHQNGSSSLVSLAGSEGPRALVQQTSNVVESPKAASGSRNVAQQNASTARPTSSTGSGSDGKRVSTSDIQFVQNLIERCLQLYMTQAEIVQTLQAQAKIEPGFTNLVWQKLEEQNPDFFRAYYTRLKVKDQIILFNHLVEQQAQVLHKLQRTLTQQIPPTIFPRPGMPMPSMHMPGMPMNRPHSLPTMAMPGHMLMNPPNMPLPFPSQQMMMHGNPHMAGFVPSMPMPQPPMQQQQLHQQSQQLQQQQSQAADEHTISQLPHDHDTPLDMLAAQECAPTEDMGLLPMNLRGSATDLMSGLAFGTACQTSNSSELPDLNDHGGSGFPKTFSFSDINALDITGPDSDGGMGSDLPRNFSLPDFQNYTDELQ